jgi:hypothetical protein
MTNLDVVLHQLRQELKDVERHVEKLDEAIIVIERLARRQSDRGGVRPRQTMSVAARKRMSLGQKRRWAKWKASKKAD